MPPDPANTLRRCPSCQTEARQTAVFCRICGLHLPTSDKSNQAVKEGSTAEKEVKLIICSACGYDNIPGEVFCTQCGVQLPPVASLPPSLPSKFNG